MRDESAIEHVNSQPETTRDAAADVPDVDHLLRKYDGLIARIAASYEFHPVRAQDLTQEILIAVWRAWSSFRGECSARTFVARIAHYRAVTHVAKLTRRPAELELAVDLPCAHPLPEMLVMEDEMQRQLRAALQRLPLAYRQVATLLLEGFTTAEVADCLGITPNAVAIRSTRARTMLRNFIGKPYE